MLLSAITTLAFAAIATNWAMGSSAEDDAVFASRALRKATLSCFGAIVVAFILHAFWHLLSLSHACLILAIAGLGLNLYCLWLRCQYRRRLRVGRT